MGQKVHPTGIRLGIVKKHTSTWYAGSDTYAEKLHADMGVRKYIEEKLANASVSRVDIERPANTAKVTIHTARPGIVIGRKGEDVDKLRAEITKRMGVPVHINIEEIRKPDLDAKLVAEGVASQLERRVMFRRAMKRQGKGKGNVEYWVAQIQPGKVLYEMEGVSEELAREAFALAAAKLPILTTFVKRSVM